MSSAPSQKKDVAHELAQHHFEVEEELTTIVILDVKPETITLLEVSGSTPATGSLDVFVYAPTKEVPFTVQIAEITPSEYEAWRGDDKKWPDGWDLGKGETIERGAA